MNGSTLFALLLLTGQAYGWGQTGHRITGAIAEQYLTDEARAAIAELLPNESLSEASTYADEMRSNPSQFWQKTASPWHYVTVPDGKTYTTAGAPGQGDSVTALKTFRETLRDHNSTRLEKQLALRFIVHLVGDLHQPLHAGNGKDRGGNNVKLRFFGEESNLHRVWDSGLIGRQQLSYTEWSVRLSSKITPSQIKAWSDPDPLVWIAESVRSREALYLKSDNEQSGDLSWAYVYQNLPTVKLRLQQGGVRIAAFLNEALGKK